MSLIEQLNELWVTGRLVLDHPLVAETPSDSELVSWIDDQEQIYRRQLPEEPPVLEVEWALWACKQLVRAAQLLVYRELGEEFIHSGLETLPKHLLPVDAEANREQAILYVIDPKLHYSVDLFFRFLPDLNRLARAASGSDPLLQVFQRWAEAWPLSGVGINRMQEETEAMMIVKDDIFLATLYHDRKLLRHIT